ncbi:uncharacterized protein BO80DRAFT_74493 [Aspergillus ibericus CBS 121593]|uniref:Uncharacterized protein n=1 Tax=Aspergillus ibericus CBS 121593 TaxID=1448316 RepID=A0A395HCZ8_9EURO|nr:hypothetical protein BO80DRAFT_74493 [Aspergillus ibericus CBS 121593]RAL05600.1 hypothetical protein BO80DRAFT_74493 [Aspergillus ibericus CBS 121593]
MPSMVIKDRSLSQQLVASCSIRDLRRQPHYCDQSVPTLSVLVLYMHWCLTPLTVFVITCSAPALVVPMVPPSTASPALFLLAQPLPLIAFLGRLLRTCLIFKLSCGYVGHPHWPYHPNQGPMIGGVDLAPFRGSSSEFSPGCLGIASLHPPMPPGVATLWTGPARLASLSGPIPRNPLSGHWARLFWSSPPKPSSSVPPPS